MQRLVTNKSLLIQSLQQSTKPTAFLSSTSRTFFNNSVRNNTTPLRSINTVSKRSFHATKRTFKQVNDAPPAKKFVLSEFRKFVSLAKPHRWILAGAMVCLGLNAASNLLVPYYMGKSMDSIINPPKEDDKQLDKEAAKKNLIQVAAVLAGVFAVGSMAMFGRVALLNITCERIVAGIRVRLFNSLAQQEIGFFDKNRTGELINRLSSDTTIVSKTLTDSIASGLIRSVQGIGGIGILMYLTPQLTLLMLTVVPVVAIGGVFYGRRIRKLSRDAQTALGKSTELAEEIMGNIRTVKMFAQEDKEVLRYQERNMKVFDLGRRAGIYSGSFYGVIGFLGNTALLSVLTYGGTMAIDQQLTVGELTSFLLYSVYVAFALSGIANTYGDIMKGLGATERIFELSERTPQILSPVDARTLTNIEGSISFENVSFCYPSRTDANIFTNLTLRIDAGQIVAVVGQSGSGKSTILALLGRFYDATSGRITLDSHDITTLDLKWLRRQIGFVSQDPVLFSGTIRENIAYGLFSEEWSDEKQYRELLKTEKYDKLIRDAAIQANADSFISKFPDGYDTEIGERGVTLSGGQKQRIAIARAIIKNPKILVLDEATSALDSESEFLVQQALENLMKGRTTLIVAHRLSTVKKANTIVVLASGQIVEQGSHSELMQNGSVYANLVSKQMAQ